MKLYVAYGSNLNKEQMSHRCPDAKPVYTGYLENWELIYRGSKLEHMPQYAGKRIPSTCRCVEHQ